MKITKERLTRIIKEEISNVLEIKYKSGDWSYQSPEREKELEAARVKIQNKMDILATKMDDFNDMLSAEGRGPTDEEARAYAELENEYRKQNRLKRAVTPAPPPEPEDDYFDDSPDPGPGFDAVRSKYDQRIMKKIKSLVPPNIQSQGEEAIYDHLEDAKEDSKLYKLIRALLDGPGRKGGNWNLEDLPRPKMWNSIP